MDENPYDYSDSWLSKQERFLGGLVLRWTPYKSNLPKSDHEHCEICCAKFMEDGVNGTQRAGYVSADKYRWICPECFDRFKARFRWTIQDES